MGANVYPVFLRLEGRRVLVVGGGTVAAGKLPALLDAGAQVTVVAPRIADTLRRPGVTLVERVFRPDDVDGAFWVIAAATPEVNREVARVLEGQSRFVNAVDDPASASAYTGGVVHRAGLTIGISTGGDAPALAGLIREALEAVLPHDLDAWLELARQAKRQWRERAVPMARRRPLLLQALNDLYRERDAPARGVS
ncbi:MAG: bifunctional precorrin-2 dehydrogenase/sirohydrochlorin ferrochelatase [Myxococcota bacterium]